MNNWRTHRWPWPLPVAAFLFIVGALILLALYGWWTGAWEVAPGAS
jgi:hypothetical protein